MFGRFEIIDDGGGHDFNRHHMVESGGGYNDFDLYNDETFGTNNDEALEDEYDWEASHEEFLKLDDVTSTERTAKDELEHDVIRTEASPDRVMMLGSSKSEKDEMSMSDNLKMQDEDFYYLHETEEQLNSSIKALGVDEDEYDRLEDPAILKIGSLGSAFPLSSPMKSDDRLYPKSFGENFYLTDATTLGETVRRTFLQEGDASDRLQRQIFASLNDNSLHEHSSSSIAHHSPDMMSKSSFLSRQVNGINYLPSNNITTSSHVQNTDDGRNSNKSESLMRLLHITSSPLSATMKEESQNDDVKKDIVKGIKTLDEIEGDLCRTTSDSSTIPPPMNNISSTISTTTATYYPTSPPMPIPSVAVQIQHHHPQHHSATVMTTRNITEGSPSSSSSSSLLGSPKFISSVPLLTPPTVHPHHRHLINFRTHINNNVPIPSAPQNRISLISHPAAGALNPYIASLQQQRFRVPPPVPVVSTVHLTSNSNGGGLPLPGINTSPLVRSSPSMYKQLPPYSRVTAGLLIPPAAAYAKSPAVRHMGGGLFNKLPVNPVMMIPPSAQLVSSNGLLPLPPSTITAGSLSQPPAINLISSMRGPLNVGGDHHHHASLMSGQPMMTNAAMMQKKMMLQEQRNLQLRQLWFQQNQAMFIREREQFFGNNFSKTHDDGGNSDPYANLMSKREKDLLINIQMKQLYTEDPFLDDYYYTMKRFKDSEKKQQMENDQKESNSGDNTSDDCSNNVSNGDLEEKNNPKQPKASLFIVPKILSKKSTDDSATNKPLENSSSSAAKQYFPHLEGALGKISCSSVHNPRTIIDVSEGVLQKMEDNAILSSNEQREKRHHLQLLAMIEACFVLVLDVECLHRQILTMSESQLLTELRAKRSMVIDRIAKIFQYYNSIQPWENDIIRHLNAIRKGVKLIHRVNEIFVSEEL